MATVLIVDDNSGLREQMKWALCDRFTTLEADSTRSCMEVFNQQCPPVICLDMGLDNVPRKGLEIIDLILTKERQTKIIVITANTDASLGPEAVRHGAFDFLNKPIDIDQLKVIIDRALRIGALEEAPITDQKPGMLSDSDFLMVGAGKSMHRVFEYIRRLSKTDVCVLITGESGTGKELCARAIHYHSNRRAAPFVPINCGAIPETLIESELFGYMKGAFTGANTNKVGLIESADKGTLFLDEIADMPKVLQVKLLRFLEDHRVQRLGDTNTREVDVRVIAATNKKGLLGENAESMRSDLYYRLSEFEIDLPPLREREDDISLIAEAIVNRGRTRFSQPKLHLSPRTEKILKTYSWPGNVRELENKLNRAAITCENQTIEPEDLQLSASSFTAITLKEARDLFERDFIINVLRRANFNITKAATQAGISRPTMYDLLKKHDITIQTESSITP